MKNVREVPKSLAKAGLALLLVLLFAQVGGRAEPVTRCPTPRVSSSPVITSWGVDLNENAIRSMSTGSDR